MTGGDCIRRVENSVVSVAFMYASNPGKAKEATDAFTMEIVLQQSKTAEKKLEGAPCFNACTTWLVL